MRLAAWSLLALYLALAAAALALIAFQSASSNALGAVACGGFAGVGALIALRRPDNAVGWILLGIAIAFAAGETALAYAAEPANPGRVGVAWVASWTINVWFTLATVFLPLLFPHGRLPSRRWRPILWLGVADLVLGAGGSALAPGPLELQNDLRIENPVGVEGELTEVATTLGTIIGAVAVVLAAASVVVRLRRARGVERQQLKWFAYVGVLAATCLFVAVLVGSVLGDPSSGSFDVVAVVAWLSGLALLGFGLPVAAGTAILRHRLYDIDVVIRRTVVYGALSLTLLGAYLGLVLLLQLVLSPESDIAIAASTLAVAALVRPARARIQEVVDRRFFRRKYDAAHTIESFGSRLRDQVELDALSADLRNVVADTMQPAHVSLWLRKEAR